MNEKIEDENAPSAKRLKVDEHVENVNEEIIPELDIPQEDNFAYVLKYEGGYPCFVLRHTDITTMMAKCIEEMIEVLELPKTTLRLVLNFYKWDKDKLMDHYFGVYDGDVAKLLRVTGVPDQNVIPETYPEGNEECGICYTEFTVPRSLSTLDCGHRFCKRCWDLYISTQIMSEGMGDTISCPALGCKILLDDNTVTEMVSSSKVIDRYQNILANSFIQGHKCFRWCPAPSCNMALHVEYMDKKPAACSCGHTICFSCGMTWHGPISCDMLKIWTKKCQDDSETSNWIAANTKPCPKCHTNIEKNGGCNHMTCRKTSCKYEFCWICLGDWRKHSGNAYNCSSYNAQVATTQEVSRSALERYVFYYNRYMNHMHSLKFENKLHASLKPIEEQWRKIVDSVEFISKAVKVLCVCRQTLMYTYVFAFYLATTSQATIFDENQKDLQNEVEKLSEVLERELHIAGNPAAMKKKILDISSYCERRRKVLLEHVYEGYENEDLAWKYNENLQ